MPGRGLDRLTNLERTNYGDVALAAVIHVATGAVANPRLVRILVVALEACVWGRATLPVVGRAANIRLYRFRKADSGQQTQHQCDPDQLSFHGDSSTGPGAATCSVHLIAYAT
jgi:hypothetical protein